MLLLTRICCQCCDPAVANKTSIYRYDSVLEEELVEAYFEATRKVSAGSK